ncbi:hypothetical protein TDMWS_07880 [Thermodesulfomicrobium sp. WS]|nr:hypothetical protein TDMWS_07880 [Thermodesulfomicrobium sp. WS]
MDMFGKEQSSWRVNPPAIALRCVTAPSCARTAHFPTAACAPAAQPRFIAGARAERLDAIALKEWGALRNTYASARLGP